MKEFGALSKWGQMGRLKGLAEKALGEFGIEGARIKPLEHMENSTFRVDGADGKRYMMRLRSPVGSEAAPEVVEARIRSEMEWLAALGRDTELVVPVPVETRDGRLLTKVEVEGVPGARVCVLFNWVYGKFYDKGLTERHVERVGEFTARLHRHVSEEFVMPKGFTRPSPAALTDELVGVIAEVRPREDVEVVERVIEKLQAMWRELGEGPDVFGLVHGDLHQWNYLFDKGEVRAIDFDDCGTAHFLYDISVTLINLKRRDDYERLKAAYLRGYRSVRELPVEHEGYLDGFFVLRYLTTMGWFVERRDHPGFSWWEEEMERGMGEMREYAE